MAASDDIDMSHPDLPATILPSTTMTSVHSAESQTRTTTIRVNQTNTKFGTDDFETEDVCDLRAIDSVPAEPAPEMVEITDRVEIAVDTPQSPLLETPAV